MRACSCTMAQINRCLFRAGAARLHEVLPVLARALQILSALGSHQLLLQDHDDLRAPHDPRRCSALPAMRTRASRYVT